MAAWREQVMIDAPVEEVWGLVADPKRYPEWAADVVDVTGLAEVAEHETFEQETRMPWLHRTDRTTFEIEKLDDMHEIKLRCQSSGYYSHWTLTPAQDSTFAEIEIGVDPRSTQSRLYFGALGKRYLRRLTGQTIDGLKRIVGRAS